MRQAILAGVVALVPLSAGAEVKSATPESMLIAGGVSGSRK